MVHVYTDKTPVNKTVSLVLGSGGARGIAHIGVIACLEEYGYEIKSIVGCSMGAVVGGIYAAGELKTYEQWLRKLTRSNVVSLMDFSFTKKGLVKGQRVINTMMEMVGDHEIKALPIQFTAVATDIKNLKEIWINKGSLFTAIRASMALPLFMTPYQLDDMQLIDGGVLNPVPIAPTFSDDTDLTIAVNLGGFPKTFYEQTENSPLTQISEFLSRRSGLTTNIEKLSLYDISNRAFDVMQNAIARQKLAAYPPDVLIEIPRNTSKALEFHRANELIEIGYNRAYKVLEMMNVNQ